MRIPSKMTSHGLMMAVAITETFIASAAQPSSGKAPVDALEAFARLPQQYVDILPVDTRLDMVDYFRADSILRVSNVYMGHSWIEEGDSSYLKVHLTDASNLQIKTGLVSKKYGPLTVALYTVGSSEEAPDTSVMFFDSDFKQIPEKNHLFPVIDPKQYFHIPKGDKTKVKDLTYVMPFYTMEITASPQTGNTTFEGKLTFSDYLTEEQMAEVSPYLRRNYTFRWNGSRYILSQ